MENDEHTNSEHRPSLSSTETSEHQPPCRSTLLPSSGDTMDANQYYILLKFDGYWSKVKNQNRMKYEGGKQRTIKVDKMAFNIFVLKEKVVLICPWLRDHDYEMHYHIFATSPKEYKIISTDDDLLEAFQNYNGNRPVEVVIIIQDDALMVETEGIMYSQTTQTMEAMRVDPFNNGLLITERESNSTLSLGLCFADAMSFKQALRTEAITKNFGVKIKASDKTRVIAICAHRGCPWRIRAAVCPDGHTFQIRILENTHLCPGVNRAGNKQATACWVASQIGDVVKKNPDISPKLINNNLENTYGLSLPYMQLWRSRELARELAFGSIDENYKWVPTLRSELISINPGSHITYVYDMFDKSFMRFYVSFKVCVDGFLAGCRPLIGLDACHLKSKYLGVLLSANSLDGNSGLFTIAFAVVEAESKSTWEWFLTNLMESFAIEVHPLAFISDMEKGLCEAMKTIFPNAEHRVCIRHLWKNLKKFFYCHDSQKLKSLVWTAANTYKISDFERKKEEIFEINSQIHSYLISLPYKWSKSEFAEGIKNHYNTSNMAESFNSWIGEARGKPVVDLVDMIRGMLMEQRAERKIACNSWRGHLVSFAEEHIREITTRKENFIIRPSTPFKAEIEGQHGREEVDIFNKKCTCNFWQVTGLPCIHAVTFLSSKEHPLWHTYVDDHYHVVRYRMAYEGAISTLPGKEQWIFVDEGFDMGVPNTLRPRGRPKKRRIKSFLEGSSYTPKSIHKCSRCGIWGHHRNTCKNPIGQSSSQIPPGEAGGARRAKLPIRREGGLNEIEESDANSDFDLSADW